MQETISTLNSLIATCRDGEQGFRNAAEHLRDVTVKAAFNDFARERASFAAELKQEVQRLGGVPDEGGSVSGALHRGWMDVKGAVAGRDDEALISEAERGEDVAVATYQEALRANLPTEIRTLVQRQYSSVQRAHDRVKALRDARKGTHA
jgi:uncharacterized protein (TIGR02284 family)